MQEGLRQLLDSYPLLAPAVFIVVRSLAIIIPPITGAFIDLAGIAAFGPLTAFFLGEAGLMLGAVVAFLIARRFREPAVRRFTALEGVTRWEESISEARKFWTLVLIRLPTNAFFDYVSYAAGLTKIGFWKFFFSTLIGHLPGTIIFFLVGGVFYQSGVYYFVVFVVSLVVVTLATTKGGRIIERLRRLFLAG